LKKGPIGTHNAYILSENKRKDMKTLIQKIKEAFEDMRKEFEVYLTIRRLSKWYR